MSPRKGRGAGTNGNGAGTNGDGTGLTDDQLASLELEEEFDEELEFAAEDLEAEEHGEKRHNVLIRLYRGETSFDFIGRRRWWFLASAVVILLGVISLSTRGLNLGIDFKGGQSWLVTTNTLTVAEATSTAEAAGVTQPTVVQLTDQITHTRQIEVTADLNSLSVNERQAIEFKVTDALAAAAHTAPNNVNFNDVGPTWGGQVTSKAIEALIVFYIAVTIYISIRFEFKMAVAAIVAVIHDILITIGAAGSWRALGDEVRAALSEALLDPAGWTVDASSGPELETVAAELLAGSVGALAASHGGSIELVSVLGHRVTVRMSGACDGCPAATSTLRDVFERELRRVDPSVVVCCESDSAAISLGKKLLSLIVR